MTRRRGIAIGVVFVVLIVLFVGGMTLSHLMRGVQRQLEFSDAHIRCQYIGEAAMNLQLARLLSKPWEARWFAAGPDSASDLPYGGGNYDYFIQDTADKPFHVDLWIRSTFRNARRCFFWRVKYDHGLLGGLAQGLAVNRLELEPEQSPPTGTTVTTPFTERIKQIINERTAKRNRADVLGNSIRQNIRTDQILTGLGRPAEGVVKNSPFPADVATAEPPAVMTPGIFPVLQIPGLGSVFSRDGKKFEKAFKDWLKENKKDPDLLTSMMGIFDSGFSDYTRLIGENKFKEAKKKLNETLRKINGDFDQEEIRMDADDDEDGDDWDIWDLFDFEDGEGKPGRRLGEDRGRKRGGKDGG